MHSIRKETDLMSNAVDNPMDHSARAPPLPLYVGNGKRPFQVGTASPRKSKMEVRAEGFPHPVNIL